MRSLVHRSWLGAALAAIALAGCGPNGSPDAASPGAAEPEVGASAAELSEVLRDPDAYSRARRLGGLLAQLGPDAVPEVVARLGDRSLDLGGAEIELLVRFWAAYEPLDAVVWAFGPSPPGYQFGAVRAAVEEWARVDPEAALVSVVRWGTGRSPASATAQVALVRGWYHGGHPRLEQYIRELGTGFERQRAAAAYARALVQAEGADAVLRWADSVPEDDASYKLDVYRQVGATLPLFDRDAALRWCDAHCDGPHGDGVRTMIARRWVLDDGEEALEWILGTPENKEKKTSVRVVFAMWGRDEREAALRWMEARLGGSDGEADAWTRALLAIYARLVAEESPVDAIPWAERVEEERERDAALADIAAMWREEDEAAAEAWLLQSSLSEKSLERARRPRRRPEAR